MWRLKIVLPFSNTILFIHGSACLASGLYNVEVRNTAKKQNLSGLRPETKMRETEKKVLFVSLKSWIKETQ